VASLVIVVSAVLVLLCGQNRQTDTQTDADERYTPATVVGVSNKKKHQTPTTTQPRVVVAVVDDDDI